MKRQRNEENQVFDAVYNYIHDAKRRTPIKIVGQPTGANKKDCNSVGKKNMKAKEKRIARARKAFDESAHICNIVMGETASALRELTDAAIRYADAVYRLEAHQEDADEKNLAWDRARWF